LSAAEMRTLITQHAQPFPKRPDQPLGSGILDATATLVHHLEPDSRDLLRHRGP
jgi:hypothetical protein